ncbi:MAG: putative membrane protein [Gammaproteobacteria bacterium]|jgi:putative membrane protein
MEISALLDSILHFGAYFGASLVFLVVFKFAYTFVTPHDELKLIKEDKNTAAAIGFGGAVIGFSIALSGAASNSVSLVDFVTWGIIALIAQLLAFALVRFFFLPLIVERIQSNEVSAGTILGATSIAVGLLNAACMTY